MWTTSCPGASFDDPTLESPTLTLDSPPPCPVACEVSLTVTDSTVEGDIIATAGVPFLRDGQQVTLLDERLSRSSR